MILRGTDAVFMIAIVLGAFALVPLIGAACLRLSCRFFRVPTAKFGRCWLSYLLAYVAASVTGTLILLARKGADVSPDWLAAVVFGQAVLVHFVVVPLILQTGWRKSIAAHGVALLMYAAVLALALTPALLHAKKSARRITMMADLKSIGWALHEYSRESSQRDSFPATLEELERAGYPIRLTPRSSQRDFTYLGNYIQQQRKLLNSPVQDPVRLGSARIRNTVVTPLVWVTSLDLDEEQIAVCFFDGHVEIILREEFQRRLRVTMQDLGEADK